jgi:hypothetical protein
MKQCAVMVAVVGLRAGAQGDEGEWRLREVTAEAYLAGLPDFKYLYENEYGYQAREIIPAVEAEFLYRYAETADYATLSAAFDKLKVQFAIVVSRAEYPVIDYNPWIARIVQAWLTENAYIRLEDTSAFRFDDYTISVVRRDFDNDFTPEYLLNVIKAEGEYVAIEYNNYLIAGRIDHIMPVPVPWRGYGYDEGNIHNRPLFEVAFQDITADGKLEWILRQHPYFQRFEFSSFLDVTYILGWQDDQLVRYATIETVSALLPQFTNLDTDEALEISTSFIHADNWGCGYTENHVYDWDGETYVAQELTFNPLDCTARQAEEAMWAGDFNIAIDLYDQFIAEHRQEYEDYRACQKACDCVCGSLNIEIFLYFLARRTVAYALLHDTEGIDMSLAAMDDFDAGFLRDSLTENGTDPQAICQAAYDQWVGREAYDPKGVDFVFAPGTIMEGINSDTGVYPRLLPFTEYPLDPARAGCDIRMFEGVPTPIPTLLPTVTPTSTPDARSPQEIQVARRDIYAVFKTEDYETALLIATNAVPEDDIDAARWRYWRALALEALGRPEEALAEYVAIYENAPESA